VANAIAVACVANTIAVGRTANTITVARMANTIAVVSVAVVRRRRIGGGVSRGIVIGVITTIARVITTIARVITTIARVITTIAAIGIPVTIAVSRSGECGTNECACG
jgi:hypothetical protein